MSSMVYTSISHQRQLLPLQVLGVASNISDYLAKNPVLQDVTIKTGQGPQGPVIAIEASVQANGADKLAVIMALAAADEQWFDALHYADAEKVTAQSRLRHV